MVWGFGGNQRTECSQRDAAHARRSTHQIQVRRGLFGLFFFHEVGGVAARPKFIGIELPSIGGLGSR